MLGSDIHSADWPAVTEHQFTEHEDDWGFKKYMTIMIIQNDPETWLNLDDDESLHVSVGVTMRLDGGASMRHLKSLYGLEPSAHIKDQMPVVLPALQVCRCCQRPARFHFYSPCTPLDKMHISGSSTRSEDLTPGGGCPVQRWRASDECIYT